MAKVKEWEMGIGVGRPWFWAVSKHVLSASIFAGSVKGVKLHADQWSEKVRWLAAGSVSNSKVLYGNSLQRLPLVLQVLCRQPLALDERLR